MDTLTMILFAAGLALLIAGAEILVRGASRLALAAGISPLIIGLTVVAFGTSSPELAVALQAAGAGQPGIVLGNVIGSNIFNILFIVGLSAAIASLVVAQQLVRLDVPIMIGLSLLLFGLALDGSLSNLDGSLLFFVAVGYTLFLIRQSRRESREVEAEYDEAFGRNGTRSLSTWLGNLALVVVGLAMLVLGSRWLVGGAVAVARVLGLSELIIGLTIVAAGTSLPEVATSIIAALRGERDIAVGNAVGSNLFNISLVLGLTSLLAPGGMPVESSVVRFDLPVMLAVAVVCLPIFFTGYRIARWEGFVLLGYYLAYTLYLVLDAAGHDALPVYSGVMLFFVVPLTALTLLIVTFRSLRQRRVIPTPG